VPPYEPGDSITTGDLLRRIWPSKSYFQNNQPTSAAFRLRPNETYLSAHLEELTTEAAVLMGHPDFGLARISVGAIIQMGLSVIFDPNPNGTDDPAHVQIIGDITAGVSRKLSRVAATIKAPNIPEESGAAPTNVGQHTDEIAGTTPAENPRQPTGLWLLISTRVWMRSIKARIWRFLVGLFR